MMNNKRSGTERHIPAFELSLRKYQERSQWGCSSSGLLGLYRFKRYHLNITQGVLDKNRSQNSKQRDTQAVRQGMKKEEEEEEEKKKLERNLVVSQCCCLVQSPSNVKQKIKEPFNYTHTTTQETNQRLFAQHPKKSPTQKFK